MRFAKSVVAALVVSLATLVAVPALAETGAKRPTPTAEEGGKHGKKFPMAGAEFKAKVDQRVAKARQHMESRVTNLPADKQKEVRDKFNAGVATLNAEVQKAVADNVVTKEEAQKVREVAKQLRGGHGHGGHGKKAKAEKK
jgi:hypothetical protein